MRTVSVKLSEDDLFSLQGCALERGAFWNQQDNEVGVSMRRKYLRLHDLLHEAWLETLKEEEHVGCTYEGVNRRHV